MLQNFIQEFQLKPRTGLSTLGCTGGATFWKMFVSPENEHLNKKEVPFFLENIWKPWILLLLLMEEIPNNHLRCIKLT